MDTVYKLTGSIKLILDEQTFGSGFTKRAFVVTTDGDKYPQDIQLECLKDKTTLLDGVAEGQRVTVSFNVNGREWEGRYFVNLVAWRIEAEGAAHHAPGNQSNGSDDVLDEPPF